MITVIPAIDIIDGACVRLTQGDYNALTTYYRDPLDAAMAFEQAGLTRLHLVDLDGAKSASTRNLHVLERIATRTSLVIDYGGGLRTRQSIVDAFSAGAAMAGVGSVAAREPQLFASWLDEFGGNRLMLGVDERDGRVAVAGWLEDTPLTVCDVIDRFTPHGLTQAVCTDIARDGMLCGPSVDFYTSLQQRYPAVDIVVSGGIGTIGDIESLDRAGLRAVIVGKALYEGRITLKDLERCSLNA